MSYWPDRRRAFFMGGPLDGQVLEVPAHMIPALIVFADVSSDPPRVVAADEEHDDTWPSWISLGNVGLQRGDPWPFASRDVPTGTATRDYVDSTGRWTWLQ